MSTDAAKATNAQLFERETSTNAQRFERENPTNAQLFERAKPTNAQLFERAQKVIPGGVNSPVRAFRAVGGTPRFIARAQGPYLFDAEGTRYIDYIGSWGPMILGHGHPAVLEAVQKAAVDGFSFGAPTEREVELAEEILSLVPSMEQVRLVSSGTEAAMSALRLARGATGRSKIVKFEGCYHGHADALLVKAGSGLATFGHPTSAGVPPEVVQHTLVLEYNNVSQLEEAFALHGGRGQSGIACVMIEPIAGNMNFVRASVPFMKRLRELCTQHGTLLVFDEVMTGFRVALGGAQSLYAAAIPGFAPDLSVFGKVIGGGMPLAAFGGPREVMQQLAPLGPVYQAGTLSGNPVATACGLATLREIRKPGFFDALSASTCHLLDGLLASARAAGVPMVGDCEGGMFGFFFSSSDGAPLPQNYTEVMATDKERFNRFFHAMLDRGVYLAPAMYEAGFVSSAHSAADIAATAEAALQALPALR
jgi:glutamate-1-semialdehyde 2,1-aminomutase